MSDAWDWTLAEVIAHPQEAWDYIRKLQALLAACEDKAGLLQRSLEMLCKDMDRVHDAKSEM